MLLAFAAPVGAVDTFAGLGMPPGAFDSHDYGVSADGSVVVGYGTHTEAWIARVSAFIYSNLNSTVKRGYLNASLPDSCHRQSERHGMGLASAAGLDGYGQAGPL